MTPARAGHGRGAVEDPSGDVVAGTALEALRQACENAASMSDRGRFSPDSEGAFDAHYRRLIRRSVVRSSEADQAYHEAMGHRLRARRARRRAFELYALGGEDAPALARRPPAIRRATGVAWLSTAAFLTVGLLVFGIRTWWTGAADLALIALTFGWFFLDTTAHEAERPRARTTVDEPVLGSGAAAPVQPAG